mgnify:CR=1 FL=1
MSYNTPLNKNGFTLIELMVTLTILVALAGITIKSTNDMAFQARYEQTQDMADRIKKAIAGHPGRLVNGQPDVNGYVADMGRTPEYLRDLLQAGFCRSATKDYVSHASDANCTGLNEWDWAINTLCLQKSDTTIDTAINTAAACIPAATHVWIGSNTDIDTDTTNDICDPFTTGAACTNLKHGWNGPYIVTSKPAENTSALRDGWANPVVQANNYGWTVTPASIVGGVFSIESYGRDHADTANNCFPLVTNKYTDDCITPIGAAEYTTSINTLNIKVNTDQSILSAYTSPTEISFCTDTDNAIADEATCDLSGTTDRAWDAATAKCLITHDSTIQADCNTSAKRWNTTLSICTKVLNLETKNNCLAVSLHNWDTFINSVLPQTYLSENICMKIHYRKDGVMQEAVSSNYLTVTRDGGVQDVLFEFDSDLVTPGIQESTIPNGINAIGVYEYDSAATPNCTTTTYPLSHAIQHVTFAPYKSINNLVW